MIDVGSKWNGWTVESFIGEGSFGKVFKITREEYGFTYVSALKVIHIPQSGSEMMTFKNEGMDDETVTDFYRGMVQEVISEFQLMSTLRGHSNIVSYEDDTVTELKDEFGWEICLRMEYLEPLYSYVKHHPMTVSDIVRLGMDMCKALELCQKHNIIHRDIKPDNIFYSTQDSFKLGDFGIARKLEKTSSGMSKKGTYFYMAPEVYKGEPYDSSVDIYSLGLVLYRFLNYNRGPFQPQYPEPVKFSDNENANALRMAGEKMTAPCNAPDKLAEIVLRACSYEPDSRYKLAEDMYNDLAEILAECDNKKAVYPVSLSTKRQAVPKDEEIKEKPAKEETVIMFSGSDTSYSEPVNSVTDISEPENEQEMPEDEDEQKPIEPAEESGSFEPGNETVILDTGKEPEVSEDEATNEEPETTETEVKEEKPVVSEAGITKEKPEVSEDEAINEEPEDRKSRFRYGLILALAGCILIAGGFFGYQYLNPAVPDVKGASIKSAKKQLSEAGLQYDVERRFDNKVKQDNVISLYKSNSAPLAAGERIRRGSKVSLLISRGKPVRMPNLKGKSYKKSVKNLKKKGLIIKLDSDKPEKYSDTIKKGCIISQSIDAGYECEKGTEIQVVKSKGKKKYKVPDVAGKTQADAEKALKSKHLVFTESWQTSSSVKKGNVISQNPAAGTKLEKGSQVALVISSGVPVRRSSGSRKSSRKRRKVKTVWRVSHQAG